MMEQNFTLPEGWQMQDLGSHWYLYIAPDGNQYKGQGKPENSFPKALEKYQESLQQIQDEGAEDADGQTEEREQQDEKANTAQDSEATPESSETEEKSVVVKIRTRVWQGSRLAQRRRARLVAFPDWGEHEVSDEQLNLLKSDEMIDVQELKGT